MLWNTSLSTKTRWKKHAHKQTRIYINNTFINIEYPPNCLQFFAVYLLHLWCSKAVRLKVLA